jgi:hypothetical protein
MSAPDPDPDAALSAADAARALGEVDLASRRAAAFGTSVSFGAGLILWGLIWLVCNCVGQVFPAWAGQVWLPGVAVGAVGNWWLYRKRVKPMGARGWVSGVAVYAFIAAAFAILKLHDPAQVNAFISLIVALTYVLYGLWRAGRIAWIGVGLAALTLIGWYAVQPYFYLWMGVAGGGSMILAGLWLRRL